MHTVKQLVEMQTHTDRWNFTIMLCTHNLYTCLFMNFITHVDLVRAMERQK